MRPDDIAQAYYDGCLRDDETINRLVGMTDNANALLIIADQKTARMKYDMRALLDDAKDAIEVGYHDVALERIQSLLRMIA